MAKKISYSDIADGEPLKPLIDSAIKLMEVLNGVQSELKGVAETIKQSAKQNPFENYSDVKKIHEDLSKATVAAEQMSEANKQLKTITAVLSRDFEKEAQVLDDVKGSLNSNIRLLAQYKGEQKQVADALKTQNDRLKNGMIGVAEYEKATAGLLKRQIELKTAASSLNQTINAQTKSNISAEGSMEAISQNLGQLRAAYRALSEEERTNIEIGGVLLRAISEEDAKIKALDSTIGNFQRNVGDYATAFSGAFDVVQRELIQTRELLKDSSITGKQLEELRKREELLTKVTRDLGKEYKSTQVQQRQFRYAAQQLGVELGQQNELFIEFKDKVGDGVDALSDINRSIKLAASDTNQLDRLISAANGVAGAFGVAQGAAALFGDENEDLQKTFTKLTAISTVLNGLQAIQAELRNKDSIATKIQIGLQKAYSAVIGTSTGALKAFRTALIATGVGAFVVLLGALIANWDRVKNVLNIGVNPATKKLAEETQKAMEASEKALEAFDLEARKLRALGTATIDIIALEKERTENALVATQARLEAQKKTLEETIKNRATWKRLGFNLLGTTDADVKEAEDLLTELTKKIEEYSTRIIELQTESTTEIVSQARLLEDLRLEAMREGIDKQIQAENLRYQRQIEELGTNYAAITQAEIIHLNNLEKIRKDFAEQAAENEFKYRQLVIDNMKAGTDQLIAQENLNYDRRRKEYAGNLKALEQLRIQHNANIAKILSDEAKLYQKLLDEITDLQVEAFADETEREIAQAFLQKERRKQALREQYTDNEELQKALQLLDENYSRYEKKRREEKSKADAAAAIQKKQDEITYQENLQTALLDQQRANFDSEVEFEKYKQKELRKIRIAAIEAQLKAIEGQTSKEFELLRQQLKAQLVALNAEIKQEAENTAKEATKQLVEKTTKTFNELNKVADAQAARREQQFAKDVELSKKRQDELRLLAIAGDKDAQQSIAAEDKRQAEIERARDKAQRAKARRELVISGLNTYNAKVQAGEKNALGKTIRDITALSAAINSLPLFFEGTEDTGAGGKVDNKGGFLAINHPNERIMTAEQNKPLLKIGLSNEEVVARALMFESATKIPVFTSSDDTAVAELKGIKSELQAVKDAIENIPSYDGVVDITRQVAIEIWKSKNNTKTKTTRIGGAWDR